MNINDFNPSIELYHHVRGGFVSQGSSLGEWCKNNKTNTTNAKACLMGTWNGPKGKALRTELIKASGITEICSEAV